MEIKKGYLINKDTQRKYYVNISICDGMICDDSKEFYEFYRNLPSNEQKIIKDAFQDENAILSKQEARDILLRYCKGKFSKGKNVFNHPFEIFYEEKTDIDGNKYGIEILTSDVFPIPEKINGDTSVVKKGLTRHTFCDVRKESLEKGKCNIFYFRGYDHKGFLTFSDRNHNKYYSCVGSSKNLTTITEFNLYNTFKDSCHEECVAAVIRRSEVKRYRICVSLNFIHNNTNRLDEPLIEVGYANEKEVHSYQMIQRNYGTLRDKVNRLNNLNNIKDDNLFFEDDGSRKNSSLLELINEVESLLMKLSNINGDVYNSLKYEYDSIISENNLAETDKYKELEEFRERVKSNMVISTDGDMAITFLNNYICQIVEDFKKLGFTNIPLEYLTEIHREYLKNEKGYSIQCIQKINNRFNLLYLLYLYCNRISGFNTEKVEKSYIKSSIRGLVNTIQALMNVGVIDPNALTPNAANAYSLLIGQPEIELNWLLEFICGVELKDLEKVKEYIK